MEADPTGRCIAAIAKSSTECISRLAKTEIASSESIAGRLPVGAPLQMYDGSYIRAQVVDDMHLIQRDGVERKKRGRSMQTN